MLEKYIFPWAVFYNLTDDYFFITFVLHWQIYTRISVAVRWENSVVITWTWNPSSIWLLRAGMDLTCLGFCFIFFCLSWHLFVLVVVLTLGRDDSRWYLWEYRRNKMNMKCNGCCDRICVPWSYLEHGMSLVWPGCLWYLMSWIRCLCHPEGIAGFSYLSDWIS